ncbi:MAG: hypothetical protein IPL53_14140 [Ignavibacteria bacterium]|nr:hypothetical protein [Ignavibacteria bacterium]
MDSGELNDYNNIISLEEDSNGDILIGTDRDGMKVFDRKENKIRDHSQNEYLKFTSLKNISCIKLIDENIIIIGTKGYGLFVFDKLKNTLINYTYDSVNQTCIGSNRISFIFKDKNNDIWIGANNLNLFNRESGSFKKFSLWRDKNYSGDIETIYEDMNSNLWIGITWDIKGMTGLAKFDKEKV